MVHKILLDIGLSEKEAKVYLASLRLGSQPVSVISKESGVNRSTGYVILKSLLSKGLVSKYLRSDILYFTPTPPENIQKYIDRKKLELDAAKKNIELILPELEMSTMNAYNQAKISFFEGYDGLCNMYDFTLELGVPISEYVINYETDSPKIIDFWYSYSAKRTALKIPIRLLITENPMSLMLKNRDANEYRETRFAPDTLFPTGNTYIIICGDHYGYFAYVNQTIRGALIEDASLARMEQHIFNYVWDSCKPYNDKLCKKLKLD